MFNPKTTTDDYIYLIVTHECNMHCPFCVDLNRGKNEYISIENVYKAINYCIENNVKTITILGGEPTLHPQIRRIAYLIKAHGLDIVMTTNYTKPDEVKYLDRYVDSFNISHYNQKELPKQKDFKADLTLSKLIFKGQLDNKKDLDDFIDKYKDDFSDLKFSTLTNINAFTNRVNDISDFLNTLPIEKTVTIMGEIQGQYYRNYLIKRFDVPATENAYCKRSMKMHVNGEMRRSW